MSISIVLLVATHPLYKAEKIALFMLHCIQVFHSHWTKRQTEIQVHVIQKSSIIVECFSVYVITLHMRKPHNGADGFLKPSVFVETDGKDVT